MLIIGCRVSLKLLPARTGVSNTSTNASTNIRHFQIKYQRIKSDWNEVILQVHQQLKKVKIQTNSSYRTTTDHNLELEVKFPYRRYRPKGSFWLISAQHSYHTDRAWNWPYKWLVMDPAAFPATIVISFLASIQYWKPSDKNWSTPLDGFYWHKNWYRFLAYKWRETHSMKAIAVQVSKSGVATAW